MPALRYRLEKIDPELPELLDQYVRCTGGDLSALDLEPAIGMASKAMIRRLMVGLSRGPRWDLLEGWRCGRVQNPLTATRFPKETGRRVLPGPPSPLNRPRRLLPFSFPYLVCFTWNVLPAIVIVPLRFFGFPVYAATE